MMVEFFEDLYSENPAEAHEDGDVPHVTGDPLIDKWEKEIAEGLTPDLSEGMTPDEYQSFMGWSREAHRKKKLRMNFPEDINETYN